MGGSGRDTWCPGNGRTYEGDPSRFSSYGMDRAPGGVRDRMDVCGSGRVDAAVLQRLYHRAECADLRPRGRGEKSAILPELCIDAVVAAEGGDVAEHRLGCFDEADRLGLAE